MMSIRRLFMLSLLAGTSLAGAISAIAQVASAPAAAPQTEPSVEEIVVTGTRASLQRSLDIKRETIGVVDSISAEDIGKLPDQNVAESLQRVPGVSIDRDQGEVLDRADSGGDAGAVADERDRLIAQREADEHVVDRVLQLSGDAVVVLRRDDEVGVGLRDLVVPRLDDRVGIGRVGEVADRSHVLLEEREVPVTQVEDLDVVEAAVADRLIEQPGVDALRGSRRAGAADDDLQLGHVGSPSVDGRREVDAH